MYPRHVHNHLFPYGSHFNLLYKIIHVIVTILSIRQNYSGEEYPDKIINLVCLMVND